MEICVREPGIMENLSLNDMNVCEREETDGNLS